MLDHVVVATMSKRARKFTSNHPNFYEWELFMKIYMIIFMKSFCAKGIPKQSCV